MRGNNGKSGGGWLTLSAVVGLALGVLTHPKRPVLSGIIGAAVGVAAGSLIDAVYEQVRSEREDGVEYYSASSPLYEDSDEVGYI